MSSSQSITDKVGLLSAIGAYTIWGTITLYWALLADVDSVEVLSHRIVWSLVFVIGLLIIRRKLGETLKIIKNLILAPRRNHTLLLLLATFFASANWLVNIMGVSMGRVVELSLGTFLTPLATMAIGVVFFSERVSKIRIAAIALAVIGVGVLITGLDRFPWFAVLVSSTWAIYGALKKKIVIEPLKSVGIEHVLMSVPAIIYLLSFDGIFIRHFLSGFNSVTSWALMGTGIVTSVPMILFSLAAQRIPMTILGIIQYTCPITTFLLGVFYFQEPVTSTELTALSFIAAAVVLYVLGNRQK